MLCHRHFIIVACVLRLIFFTIAITTEELDGKAIKGNKNALYLVKNKKKSLFPDFNTFLEMGFKNEDIKTIEQGILDSIPLGPPITLIPTFRPDDYMFHFLCDDPDRMVAFDRDSSFVLSHP